MTTVSLSLTPPATNVILHAFDWPYTRVTEHALALYQAGFKAVLVSPPMKSLHRPEGTPWWQRYQPQDYRVIDNQLGNTADFTRMINTLQACGIDVYADIVFNHMANESAIRTDLTYPSKDVLKDYSDRRGYYEPLTLFGDLSQPLFTDSDFVEAFPIEDWDNPWEVQHGRLSGGKSDPGLPTLNSHDNVVKKQQDYLRALKALGVKGFRIDAAKHLTLAHIQAVWTPAICEGMHVFGEIITDGGVSKAEYALYLDPYLTDTRLGAYDFPLFHSLFNVFEKNVPMTSLDHAYSVGEALAFDRAITFAITHDIPNNAVFINQVMTEQHERLAYCYILGRDGGVPLIYSDLDTSGIEDKAGAPRWMDSWKNPELQCMIAFHNQMHPYPMTLLAAGEDYILFSRGEQGIVAINRGESAITLPLPEGQHYRNALAPLSGTGATVDEARVGSDTVAGSITLAGKDCVMLINVASYGKPAALR
ncbi:alpha-amylase [Photobacterium japonica]|uniref:alpha-amylase family glycosyl hydrolase n=1 Tax=Photobacterium japonica TaxID=2910235 RepID=UPI003D0F8C48